MMSGGNWWRSNEISIGILPTNETSATVGVTKPQQEMLGAQLYVVCDRLLEFRGAGLRR
jgi:hypothetical protein